MQAWPCVSYNSVVINCSLCRVSTEAVLSAALPFSSENSMHETCHHTTEKELAAHLCIHVDVAMWEKKRAASVYMCTVTRLYISHA